MAKTNGVEPAALTFEEQFPVPEDMTQVFKLGEVEYRFDAHSRLPFPVKQFDQDGNWVGSTRGINTYDRMTSAGLIGPRPGYVAGVTAAVAGRQPRVIKVMLPDGTVIEGTPVREPKPKKETTPDGTPIGIDLTTGEPVA